MWYLCTVEFYWATKKNEILSFTGQWNWRTSSQVKLVRLRRPKATFFSPHVDTDLIQM
jgi:hypothetical protein